MLNGCKHSVESHKVWIDNNAIGMPEFRLVFFFCGRPKIFGITALDFISADYGFISKNRVNALN